jgi:protein-tyrosine phosphatase
MTAEVYPITAAPCGRLAIMPRPRAGDWLPDEVASWRRSGLDVIVSLLQDDEVEELGLEHKQAACVEAGLRFVCFPVPDRGVPGSAEALSQLVTSLAEDMRQGRGVGIHCRIGVGRSALVAVCVMRSLGLSLESAWEAVQRSRGLSVPDTPQQRAWVSAWAAGLGAQPTG